MHIPFFYTFVTKNTSVYTFDSLLASAHTRAFHWPSGLDTPEFILTLSTSRNLLRFLKILVD